MTIRRRVFVSGPRDEYLDEPGRLLKQGVILRIREAGYDPQYFDVPPGGGGDLAEGSVWNLANVEAVMRRCVGVVILGLARWNFAHEGRQIVLPTEYCHYEGSLARALRLPILALADEGIDRRGIFIPYGLQVLPIPARGRSEWARGPEFGAAFGVFVEALAQRYDVFLGYSSSSRPTAEAVQQYLRRLRVTVLDWAEDFAPAGSILDRIDQAAGRCSAGIFLFTRDDVIEGPEELAAPRDNVVFEAGFFAHAKGKERVLIVRERGSKMPADLGGDIYAALDDRRNVEPVLPMLKRFVESNV